MYFYQSWLNLEQSNLWFNNSIYWNWLSDLLVFLVFGKQSVDLEIIQKSNSLSYGVFRHEPLSSELFLSIYLITSIS